MPVVASRFPILEELVEHGKTGLLVQPSDSGALADAILALLRDPQKREHFGKRAHDIARSRYDLTVNVKRIMQVHDRVLGENRIYPDSADLKA